MSKETEKQEAAVPTIYAKMAKIMQEVGAIGKESYNKGQNFNFRGIDAVMNHLHPIFAGNDVVILPEVISERMEDRKSGSGGNLIYRILLIKFHFVSGFDGSEVCSIVVGEGMDSGDKAANKAMAVGLKYALTQMLLLPYDEVDPDGEGHSPSTPTGSKAGSTSRQATSTPAPAPEKPQSQPAGSAAAPAAAPEAPKLLEVKEQDVIVSAFKLYDIKQQKLEELAGCQKEQWTTSNQKAFRMLIRGLGAGTIKPEDIGKKE